MARKKTNTDFINEIKDKFGDEYLFLEKYKNAKTPILCRHKCGHEWYISPTNILQGKGCPKCKKKLKYTLDDAKQMFENKGLILLANEYIDANTKMPFICKKHKDKGIQLKTLSSVINRDTLGCKYCGYEESKRKQIDLNLYDEMRECFKKNGLLLLDTEYKGVNHKYKCSCLKNPEHGVFYKGYDDVKYSNQGCPRCSYEQLINFHRYDVEYYKNIIESKGYIFINVEYNHRDNGGTKIYYICPKHKEHGVQVQHVSKIYTQGCSYCSSSNGEKIIEKYLNENNIEYIPQFKFKELKGVGGAMLSYDFFIPLYNYLIEFQGIQHEKAIDIFGGEKQLKTQKEHDSRKRKYAFENGYELIEIWYTDIDKIDEILDTYFKEQVNIREAVN